MDTILDRLTLALLPGLGPRGRIRLLGRPDLAEVIVTVGLAQNMAALLALSTEGIQRGHMRLHARRV